MGKRHGRPSPQYRYEHYDPHMPRFTIPRCAHCSGGTLPMAARKRWRGTTAQRGYGAPHIAEQKRRRARWQPGDPCAHCGRGIWQLWRIMPSGRRICLADLPHTDDRTGYLPGLAHAHCNRADGARRGNRMRGAVANGWAASRRW